MYPHILSITAATTTTTTENIDFFVSDVVYPHILTLNRCCLLNKNATVNMCYVLCTLYKHNTMLKILLEFTAFFLWH